MYFLTFALYDNIDMRKNIIHETNIADMFQYYRYGLVKLSIQNPNRQRPSSKCTKCNT